MVLELGSFAVSQVLLSLLGVALLWIHSLQEAVVLWLGTMTTWQHSIPSSLVGESQVVIDKEPCLYKQQSNLGLHESDVLTYQKQHQIYSKIQFYVFFKPFHL